MIYVIMYVTCKCPVSLVFQWTKKLDFFLCRIII